MLGLFSPEKQQALVRLALTVGAFLGTLLVGAVLLGLSSVLLQVSALTQTGPWGAAGVAVLALFVSTIVWFRNSGPRRKTSAAHPPDPDRNPDIRHESPAAAVPRRPVATVLPPPPKPSVATVLPPLPKAPDPFVSPRPSPPPSVPLPADGSSQTAVAEVSRNAASAAPTIDRGVNKLEFKERVNRLMDQRRFDDAEALLTRLEGDRLDEELQRWCANRRRRIKVERQTM